MLFTDLGSVRIVKNCDQGLENAVFSSLIFFQALKRKKLRKKNHASVTVTVVRDRKIRTAVRTNQIVGFVTLGKK